MNSHQDVRACRQKHFLSKFFASGSGDPAAASLIGLYSPVTGSCEWTFLCCLTFECFLSEMTYIESSGALNSTHSLTPTLIKCP